MARHGPGPLQVLPGRGARSGRSVRQGRARAREGRRQRGGGAAAAAPCAHAQGRRPRRQAVGDRRPRARDRGRAVAVPRWRAGHRARADRRHPRASRRDQQPARRRWRRPRPAASSAAQRKPDAEEAPRTVRADIAEMDAVLDGVAEAHALLNGLRGTARGVEQARHLAELLLAQLARLAAADHGRQSGGASQPRRRWPRSCAGNSAASSATSASTIDQMDRELRQLREAAERLRLVPAGSLFIALERTARDTARALGKHVAFEGKGGDIRLDAHVLETVQGALIQIVRNAVAHGIETGERAHGRGQAGRRARIASTSPGAAGGSCSPAATTAAASTSTPCAGSPCSAACSTRTPKALDAQTSSCACCCAAASARRRRSPRCPGAASASMSCARRSSGSAARSMFAPAPGVGTTFELVVPLSLASMEALIVEADGAAGATHSARRRAQHAARRRERDLARLARRMRSSTSRRRSRSCRCRRALDAHAVVGRPQLDRGRSSPEPRALRRSASTACSARPNIVVAPAARACRRRARSWPAPRSTPTAIRSSCSIPTGSSPPRSAASRRSSTTPPRRARSWSSTIR